MLKRLLSFTTVLAMGLGASAQISTFPWTEDFESQSNCSGSCNAACFLSGDFTNDNSESAEWSADVSGTISGSTGPTANGGADHNPGIAGGRYLYTESSFPCSSGNPTANLISPYYDFSSITSPALIFWYHMYGGTMGTMHFDIDTNGTWINDYIPSWTDNQDIWQEQEIDLSELGGMNNVRYRIRGVIGNGFGSDMAVDDFTVFDATYNVAFIDGNFEPCFNDSNGFLTVEATYGAAPYSYAWSNGDTGTTVSNLAPGTYCVTATDNNGDTVSNCTVLEPTDSILTNPILTTPLICKYDDAVAVVNGSGGQAITEPYAMDTNSANYAWDSSGTCNSYVFGGNNQVSPPFDLGFDFEFYGQTYDEFQIASNGFIGFGGGLDDGCCDGEVLPNTSTFEPNNAIYAIWGGMDAAAATYTYCIAGDAPFRRLIVNFENLKDCCTGSTPNGSAQIILHETSNCIEIQTDFWDNTNVSTFDEQTQGIANDGGTLAQWYPGLNGITWPSQDDLYMSFCPIDSSGLLYTWDDGNVGQTNSGLSAGTYNITTSDAGGCEVVDQLIIDPAPSELTLDPMITNVSCFGFNDGAVLSNETGGVAPISYAWSNNASSPDLQNIGGGMYSVTATDNLGCIDSVLNIYVDEADLLVASIYNVVNPECPSDQTGSAAVTANGGRMPYTYEWSSGQLTQNATNLMAGAYQVTITDSSDCESVQSVNILAQNNAPMVDLGTDVYNTGGGAVTLSAGNYANLLWSTGENTPTILVTSTGTYWAQATNAAGCSSSDTVYIEIWPNGINDIQDGSGLVMYPNPTKGQMTLELNAAEGWNDVLINITDLQGRVVASQAVQRMEPNQGVNVDVTDLTPGVYSLNVISDENVAKQTFVKQ